MTDKQLILKKHPGSR